MLLHLRKDGSGEINESEVGAVSKYEKGLFSLPFRMIFLLPFPRYLFLAASYFFFSHHHYLAHILLCGSERANMRDGWNEHNGRPCVSLFLSLVRIIHCMDRGRGDRGGDDRNINRREGKKTLPEERRESPSLIPSRLFALAISAGLVEVE